MIVKATHRFEDELQDIIESPYCPQYLKKSVKSALSQISTFPESFPVRHFDRPKDRKAGAPAGRDRKAGVPAGIDRKAGSPRGH